MMFKKNAGIPCGVSIYEPEVIENNTRHYPVSIILEDVYANNNEMENIVGLYFQVISRFFLSIYQNISTEFMVGLQDKLNWKYLLSLPYPAPFAEQKYVGDPVT
jgi:hypothetical protein